MKTLPEFKGLNPEIRTFLSDLKANNNKNWFDSNKDIYLKKVKEPIVQFVNEMAQRFIGLGMPYSADSKYSLFRINRDIRFSADKSPYKTNIGIFFPFALAAGKKPINACGAYFHIEPEECFFAGGLHSPDANEFKLIRKSIYENWEEFEGLIEDKKFKTHFKIFMQDDALKRVPSGFPSDAPSADFLKLRHFVSGRNYSFDELFSPDFCNLIIKDCQLLQPFLEFLNEAIGN